MRLLFPWFRIFLKSLNQKISAVKTGRVLFSLDIWQDIHPSLIHIPMDWQGWDYPENPLCLCVPRSAGKRRIYGKPYAY